MNCWIADATYPDFKSHDWVYVRTSRRFRYRRYECNKCKMFLNVRTLKDRVAVSEANKILYTCLNRQMKRGCE